MADAGRPRRGPSAVDNTRPTDTTCPRVRLSRFVGWAHQGGSRLVCPASEHSSTGARFRGLFVLRHSSGVSDLG